MIRINLLKPETKEVREAAAAATPEMEFKEKRTQPLFGLILVVAVLAVAALFFFQRSAINKEQDLLTKAEQEKQSLQYVVSKLEELQTQGMIAWLRKPPRLGDLAKTIARVLREPPS